MKLYYREKKKRLKRLVIIADVSGSMDRYTCLLMPFILGIKGIGSRAEAFVFSTSLTAVTFFIRYFSVEEALKKMALEVPDWSGGTNIGESLRQFNREHGSQASEQPYRCGNSQRRMGSVARNPAAGVIVA